LYNAKNDCFNTTQILNTGYTPSRYWILVTHYPDTGYWLHTLQKLDTGYTPSRYWILVSHHPDTGYWLHTLQILDNGYTPSRNNTEKACGLISVHHRYLREGGEGPILYPTRSILVWVDTMYVLYCSMSYIVPNQTVTEVSVIISTLMR
jgi:hypothetical protein